MIEGYCFAARTEASVGTHTLSLYHAGIFSLRLEFRIGGIVNPSFPPLRWTQAGTSWKGSAKQWKDWSRSVPLGGQNTIGHGADMNSHIRGVALWKDVPYTGTVPLTSWSP